MNGIEPNHQIDRFQITLTLAFQFGQEFVSDRIESPVGQLNAIDFLNMSANLVVAFPQRIQSDNRALQIIGEMSFMLLDQLRLERTLAIMWHL